MENEKINLIDKISDAIWQAGNNYRLRHSKKTGYYPHFWCEKEAKETVLNFIKSELKALKEECVGDYEEDYDFDIERREIIKAFEKRGV